MRYGYASGKWIENFLAYKDWHENTDSSFSNEWKFHYIISLLSNKSENREIFHQNEFSTLNSISNFKEIC